MGKWVGFLAAIWGFVGCGQAAGEAGSGDAGTSGSAGNAASGGSSQAGAASGGSAGASGSSVGTLGGAGGGGVGGIGLGGGGAAGSTASCAPAPHGRPAPGALSRTFSELAAGFVGVYQIDAIFGKASDCRAMCSAGNSVGGSAFAYRYLAVQISSGSSGLDVIGCETVAACADSKAVHFALGTVDTALSDRILSSQRTSVENPQAQSCMGSTVSTWLVQTTGSKLRVDTQSVNVNFPASYDPATGLHACGSGEVDSAAAGLPCNELEVIDVTKVE